MKKKLNSLIPILLLITLSAHSQERKPPARERIESMKIGFITKSLDLTPDEAKVFWPVYNMYSNELEKLHKDRRENIEDTRENFDSMSDAELEKAVDNEINYRQSEIDILKKYHPQFKKVLPVKKVARLYKAEADFKRKLLEMIQERKSDFQKGQKGNPEMR